MQPDRYSLFITWLKVLLPLLSLGILSTLFLISRAVDTPTNIPFADTEVQKRLTNQQVTGPYFTGMSASGDEITFIAQTVTTPEGQLGANHAQNVDVKIDKQDGGSITVTALEALVNLAKDETDLSGDVVVTTSQGYVLRSELLHLLMSRMEMTSPGEVTATTPVGEIYAGGMRIFTPEGSTGSQLLFTGGVKLLYSNKPLKE